MVQMAAAEAAAQAMRPQRPAASVVLAATVQNGILPTAQAAVVAVEALVQELAVALGVRAVSTAAVVEVAAT
jgi:hypothetical protein